jgi:hypothetical protein
MPAKESPPLAGPRPRASVTQNCLCKSSAIRAGPRAKLADLTDFPLYRGNSLADMADKLIEAFGAIGIHAATARIRQLVKDWTLLHVGEQRLCCPNEVQHLLAQTLPPPFPGQDTPRFLDNRRPFPAASKDSCLSLSMIDSVVLALKREVSALFFRLTKRVPSSSLFGHVYTNLFTSFFLRKSNILREKRARVALGRVFCLCKAHIRP